MKVAQINAVYEYSSTGRNTMEIHNHLKNNGIDSFVFCANRSAPNEGVFKIGNRMNHRIHALLSHLFGLQAFFSTNATKTLIERLKRESVDVVHLGNIHNNFINLPLLLKFLAKENIATVITLHDCWFFTGHCCHYTNVGCYKWQEECHNCPLIRSYNGSWLLDNSRYIFNVKRRLFGNIKNLAVVGVSDWITNQAKSSFLGDAKIIKRIYNWIDKEQFKYRDPQSLRAKLDLADDDFVVLGVAQGWSMNKGLGIIIQLAERLTQIKFVLVGGMSDNISLPPNMISVGATANVDELVEYYSLASVFVNSSIQETFGKVSAEALACGTPIVVNNATANPELAPSGCGYVVDNNSVESYIEAIDEIRKNGRGYYANNCREFAVANFDMNRNIDEHIELYREIVGV